MRLILIIKFSQFVFGGGVILIHAFLYLGDITWGGNLLEFNTWVRSDWQFRFDRKELRR